MGNSLFAMGSSQTREDAEESDKKIFQGRHEFFYNSATHLPLKKQVAAKLCYSYPTKKQRLLDEQTTGFKNVFIIRLEPLPGVCEELLAEKITWMLYKHCIVGQEIFIYPKLNNLYLKESHNITLNAFTGDDGKEYTSVVIKEVPLFRFTNFGTQRGKIAGCQCCSQRSRDHVHNPHVYSALGEHIRHVISGLFPFNGITFDDLEDPDHAKQIMRRAIAVRGKASVCLTINIIKRCLKEKSRSLARFKKIMEDPNTTKNIEKDLNRDYYGPDYASRDYQNYKEKDDFWLKVKQKFEEWIEYVNHSKDAKKKESHMKQLRDVEEHKFRIKGNNEIKIGNREKSEQKMYLATPHSKEKNMVKIAQLLQWRVLCLMHELPMTKGDLVFQDMSFYGEERRIQTSSQAYYES